MATKKRTIVDLTESDSFDHESIERPLKKRKINNNNETDPRKHAHYLKFANPLINISPPKSTNLHLQFVHSFALQIITLALQPTKLLPTNQFEPNYNSIPIDKFGISTRNISIIQSKIYLKYNKKRINIKIPSAEHAKYKQAIIKYLKKNKTAFNQSENINAHIAINAYEINNNNKNKIKYNYNFKKQNELFTISKNKLFTKHSIMAGSVIGEYNGIQMTESEFEHIYKYSTQKELAQLVSSKVYINVDDLQEMTNNNVSIVSDDEYEHEQYSDDDIELKSALDNIGNVIIIDAYGWQKYHKKYDHLLMYVKPVNDRKANIEYVTAVVNGWPRKFLVTKKKIGKNKVCKAHFGEEFDLDKFKLMRGNLSKIRLGGMMDSMLKMPLFMNDSEGDRLAMDEDDVTILHDNIDDGIIRICEDDINIKYCPKCRMQVIRTDKDIKNSCSVMTCENVNCGDKEFTYWCWDCSTVLSIKDLSFHPKTNEPAGACKNCRKLSRKRRNKCKKQIYKI